jgi:hypothetical protein
MPYSGPRRREWKKRLGPEAMRRKAVSLLVSGPAVFVAIGRGKTQEGIVIIFYLIIIAFKGIY